ncbi:HipA N-terminal domain-containing protein [Pedobacter xixiisoli]|uniref:HipA N-terminal domain-containing protein n=1 Tax=Pedobacter xixiisoli TaxID=1476464 RepID=A0A285ZZS1_9SPHI|nr:HipA N-terminal domain-containing protein [Pedobacter xixiisoli]SOD15145.1 HipA N-terminal domain-containing protein [Pedobacter xixiisoli]
MLKKIKNLLSSSKKQAISLEHQETTHLFSLKYHELEMGTLKFLGEEWVFEYADLFKKQQVISPLIDFPEPNKVYKSKILWPFFSNRIPSLKQPKIKSYIDQNPSEKQNVVKLLELFGEYSVNNPFRLQLK